MKPDLTLPSSVVETNSREPIAACVALRTRPTPDEEHIEENQVSHQCAEPESWNEIVAGGGNVTRVGKVALIEIVAPGPVPGQPLGTDPALVVRRLLYVVALNVFEAGSWHFLANVRYTVDSVTSISLNTTSCSYLLCLYSHT